MAFSFWFILIIIYLIITNERKFLEIKRLSSDKYFVIFDTELVVYTNDFTENKSILNFSKIIDSFDSTRIKTYTYNGTIFIFCLIENELFIYDDNKEKIFKFNMNSLISRNLLEYKYYNIIPYNTNNNLNLIIYSIRNQLYYINPYRSFACYYNVYIHFNIKYENENLFFIPQKNVSNEINYNLLQMKNLCFIFDSSIIKCIYYDNNDYLNLEFNINNGKFSNSYFKSFYNDFLKNYIFQENNLILNDFKTFDIISSKSKNDNYLACSLHIIFYQKKHPNSDIYTSNFTDCMICNQSDIFGDCPFIKNSYIEDCSRLKTYYFLEKDLFVLICKKFNEFILLIIDSDKHQVIDKKIIHINCTDNL